MSKNDVYVVTGAAGGMGRACAHALVDRGKLLLLDVGEPQLESVASELEAEGAQCEVMRCDVSSLPETSALTDRVRGMGAFRALVHTAGISPLMADGPRVLEVDLLGSIRITDAVFPLVVPGSSAVLIGSIASYGTLTPAVESLLEDPMLGNFTEKLNEALGHPVDGGTAYTVAKRGVMRLTERLSVQWGAKGGRAVSIAPGLIDTPMGRSELEGQPLIPAMIEATPVKRPGQILPGRPDDIAALVAFLVSDQAGFISGCDIRVDGGLMAAASGSMSPG